MTKKVIILLSLTILFSSCNLKLGGETNISTENGKLKINTNSNNEISVSTKDLKDGANKIKDETVEYIKKNSKFLTDFGTFEQIYDKASVKISESGIKALETSSKFLEKKYSDNIEKNPKIKKYFDEINSIVLKVKTEMKDGKITKELKNDFDKMKNDIEKIKNILNK